MGRRELFRRGALSAMGLGGLAGRGGTARPETPPAPAVRRSVLLRFAADGSIRWQAPVPIGTNEQGSEVAVAGSRIFLAQGGAVRSFEVASGRSAWVRPISGIAGQVRALDGLVVVVLSSAVRRDVRVVAYDQATGRPRWTYANGADAVIAYPIRAGLLIAQERYRTVALDTATGRVRWAAPVPGHDDGGSSFPQIASSPSVVVQAGAVTTAGLDADTGRRLWARALPIGASYPTVVGSVAVLTPRDFGGSAPGGVVAVDARTGADRWMIRSTDESGSVVAAGHGVVVGVTGGTVQGGRTTAVAAESGSVLWSAPVPAAQGTDEPSAITAHGVAYIEDLWHDGPGRQHRSIALVNRRLRDGHVLSRHPVAEPIAQGTPPHLDGRFLPLLIPLAGRGPVAVRLFDLATHRVRFTATTTRWPTADPTPLPDGSVISLTADLLMAVAV